MKDKFTFKRLVDASVTAGEMDQGTADYFYGLYQDSAEAAKIAAMRTELLWADGEMRGRRPEHWEKVIELISKP